MASPQEKEAARLKLAIEEASELALLEKAQRSRRQTRRQALSGSLAARHRAERKQLQAELRHKRVAVAIVVGRLRRTTRRTRGSGAPPRYRRRVENRRGPLMRKAPRGDLR